MLLGEHDVVIDGKGRIRIPKNLRSDLAGKFYITRGFEQCLLVFPESEWLKFVATFVDKTMREKNNMKMERFFMGATIQVEADQQGRINLSSALIKFAHLEKDCKIIGLMSRAEIWSKEAYEEYEASIGDISEIAEKCTNI